MRDTDRSNRRNIIVILTGKGYEVVKSLEGIIDDFMTEYINYVGEDDIKQLIAITDRLEKASEKVMEKLRSKYCEPNQILKGE